jgi:hypothetical protein
MTDVIYGYSLKQAIADGVLIELFKNRWGELSGGKPIVATTHLYSEVSLAGLREIWNDFVGWQQHVRHTLPEEEQLFVTEMNSNKIWVMEDAQAFTLMYPDDY